MNIGFNLSLHYSFLESKFSSFVAESCIYVTANVGVFGVFWVITLSSELQRQNAGLPDPQMFTPLELSCDHSFPFLHCSRV